MLYHVTCMIQCLQKEKLYCKKKKSLVVNRTNGVERLISLPPCRRRCRRPSGLLDDQRNLQTAASDHHGAQSAAAAEALQ